MDVFEAIQNRRNIKQFKPDPVSVEQVEHWLEKATYAPNHRMTEPWQVLWLGPETRAQLAHSTDFGGASVVIAILSLAGRNQEETDENIVAASCFAQNFSLAAHADGAGTRWASIGYSERGRHILGVPEDAAVIGVLGVGYPAEVPASRPRKPLAEMVKRLP